MVEKVPFLARLCLDIFLGPVPQNATQKSPNSSSVDWRRSWDLPDLSMRLGPKALPLRGRW